MQEFFMDYGLYLLIALLVVIALVFILSGGKQPADASPEPAVSGEPESAVAAHSVVPSSPAPAIEPVAAPSMAEPVAETLPAPEPETQAPIPVSPAATAIADAPDDLLKLKGVGPKLKTLLIELGVTRYGQIAAWSDADIAAIDAKLGTFKGRPVRDQWVDQAKYLAAGDTAGFEAKYGKL